MIIDLFNAFNRLFFTNVKVTKIPIPKNSHKVISV